MHGIVKLQVCKFNDKLIDSMKILNQIKSWSKNT